MANSRKDHRPECRLCGHRHFSHEPHKFEDTDNGGKPEKQSRPEDRPKRTAVVQKKPKKKSRKKQNRKKKPAAQSPDVERVQKWREENREHYNRYMRKLMRKKRAEQQTS
jgi:hypothetical protein